MWTPRKQDFAIGRMYYVSPKANDSERFYLCLLLTAVKGATSFEALRTVNNQLKPTFKEACIALGLLADNNKWHQCLAEAGLDISSGFFSSPFLSTALQHIQDSFGMTINTPSVMISGGTFSTDTFERIPPM